eukprot:scaffold1596_cov302-Pinguiococcus_pyrenoidosus.AAC.45
MQEADQPDRSSALRPTRTRPTRESCPFWRRSSTPRLERKFHGGQCWMLSDSSSHQLSEEPGQRNRGICGTTPSAKSPRAASLDTISCSTWRAFRRSEMSVCPAASWRASEEQD